MRVRHILLLLTLAAAAYLALWPVPSDFRAFVVEEAPALSGVLAPNDALDAVRRTATVGEGPEDIAISWNGALYTGIADGHILVLEPGASDWRPITLTYGRPLGLAFGPQDRWLYIADAERGLMRTDSVGHLERLVDTLGGEDLGLVDDLAVGGDGTVYFTSATRLWPLGTGVGALLAHDRTGRLFRYHPPTRRLELLGDSLAFPNGVALDPNGRTLYVAQTADYSVLRYRLDATGTPIGPPERWSTNLPGFPDGLNFDARGRLWVSLVSARSALLDRLGARPGLRKVIWRLPEQVKPTPRGFGCLVALDADGQVVTQLGGKSGESVAYAAITNAVWRGDTVYLGSLEEREVGILALD